MSYSGGDMNRLAILHIIAIAAITTIIAYSSGEQISLSYNSSTNLFSAR